MKRTILLTAIASLWLAGSAAAMPGSPMVGGPCSYEFREVDAAVLRVLDEDIELQDEDGVTFYLPADVFDAPVETGEHYRFEKRFIVEGTCTPYGFQLIGPAPAPQSEASE